MQLLQGTGIETLGHHGQLRCREHLGGIGGLNGFLLHSAGDQRPVVMQRLAQAQLQLQRLALPPGCWQRPAAGGIEQIPLMNQRSIHPQLHRISPPPQHQSRQAIPLLTLLPSATSKGLPMPLRSEEKALLAAEPMGSAGGKPGSAAIG